MLKLSKHIKLTKETVESPNLADKFSGEDLKAIGDLVYDGYKADCHSRRTWLKRAQAGMDLAMQISKTKAFPWPDCSNVAFPLITIATLQFHSFAYPEIVVGQDVVRFKEVGEDPDGSKGARAERIGRHMSYQLLEEDADWEEQHDRLLINIPIVGIAFKKSYYSGSAGHNESELVMAKDLVMDYYAKSVEECARKTHRIELSRNEIYFRVKTGVFVDCLECPWYLQDAPGRTADDVDGDPKRDGTTPDLPDQDTPFVFLEQHCWQDLDGDGYAEPYTITIEESSQAVMRIVCRFERDADITRLPNGAVLKISATEYFTGYPFMPSPDGGVYGMGFGTLLGPLNESVNALVNQLIDAGTMANTAGGFLARGAKIRGGNYTFSPLEWKRVDATGDDLKKSIFPLPVRDPSNVLLQLLQLLIQYANRIPGSTEAAAGENPGQNTPAETHRTTVEQSLKLYNAIFKRVWRSMREEFKKLYILNSIHLPALRNGGLAAKEDYLDDPTKIAPVADPHVLSDTVKLNQAQAVRQAAHTVPGYDIEKVERNFLKALRIDNAEVLYPGPQKTPPLPNPKMQVEQMKTQVKQQQLMLDRQKFVMELLEQQKLNRAQIQKLEAEAAKLMKEADGVEAGHKIALLEAQLGALKQHDEMLLNKAKLMMDALEKDNERSDTLNERAMERMVGQPGNTGVPQGVGAGARGPE